MAPTAIFGPFRRIGFITRSGIASQDLAVPDVLAQLSRRFYLYLVATLAVWFMVVRAASAHFVG